MKYKTNGQWKDIKFKVSDTLPIGTIIPYGNDTAPSNWLICDGAAVSRTTFAELFAIIGTTYGSGDGSTTFNLPNLKGKVAVGKDTSQTEFDTLGETGGSKDAVVVDHNHGFYSTPSSHTATWVTGINRYFYDVNTTTDSQTYQAYVSSTGESGTGKNLQPYQVVNYIIKAYNQVASPLDSVQVKNEYTESTDDVYSCDYVNNNVGANIPIQDDAPTNPSEGDLWIDSDDTPPTPGYIVGKYASAFIIANQSLNANQINIIDLTNISGDTDAYTINSNGIKIISDTIKCVVVDCSFVLNSAIAGTYFFINKNGNPVKRIINTPSTQDFEMNCIIPVQKNDIITMSCYVFSSTQAIGNGMEAQRTSMRILGI